MAKKKGKAKTNADNQKPAKDEIEDSPYAEIRRRLNRFRLAAVAGIVLCVTLFCVSVVVIIYSGLTSMAAFEGLPKFQVNSLVLDYRDAVKHFDRSIAGTRAKLDGEESQLSLHNARLLSQRILLSEQGFDQLLVDYGEAMASAAEQVGGALEWNRYFQADIQALRDNSAARRQRLQAVFDQFPAPHLPKPEPPAGAAEITPESNKN